jgi:hypothetical protein
MTRRAVSPVSGRLLRVWPGSVRRPWCAAPAGHGRLRTQEEPCALQSAAGASRERPHTAVRAHPDATCSTRRAREQTATAPRPCATGLTHGDACLPDATCGARLRSSTTWIPQKRSPSMNPLDPRRPRFRDVSDQEPLGMDLRPWVLAAWVVRALTGSPGLLRVNFHGLENGIHDDPLARFALASSACGAPELPGRTLARRWPLWLRADAVAADSSTTAARQIAPEIGRNGMAASSARPGARRQILRALGRPEGPQSWNSFQGAVGLQWSTVCDQASSGGRVKSSTWNRADGPSPGRSPAGLSPRPLGTRARDFQAGPTPRSTWNSRHTWAPSPSGQSAG